MAANKFLDSEGLRVLWEQIKNKFPDEQRLLEILSSYVDENELKEALKSYVEKELKGDLGTASIFNEKDGGGVKFDGKDGGVSFVGVHDNIGGELGAQIYVDSTDGTESTIIDITQNGAYYTKGEILPGEQRDIPENEIATKGDLARITVPEYSLTREAGSETTAAIYHLTKNGVAIGEPINIPKDQLLKSVEIKTCTTKDEPIEGLNVGDKYLDFNFIVETGAEQHTYLAIKDMAKPYTAGNGIVITSDNSITFDPDVLSTVDYVDQSITNLETYFTQELNNEHAGRVAGDNLLDARLIKLEMPTEPEFDSSLNILFLNGNAVRIIDNGSANVAQWFGKNSAAGSPETLTFPYGASISCGGNGKDKAMTFEGAQLIMDGGDVKTIRGGGLGACSVGNVEIIVNSGRLTAVTGGGQKYYSNIVGPNAVNNVHIIINGGEFYGQKIICGGGTDAVNVGHAEIDMNSGEVDYCYVSGGNGGFVNDSTLNMNNGKIKNLLGIVRGYIANATMNINGGEITNMFAGNDNDPGDNGIIMNSVLNILGGVVSVLRRGQSQAGEAMFNCSGSYIKGIIGNEAQAVSECSLSLFEPVGINTLSEAEIKEICV